MHPLINAIVGTAMVVFAVDVVGSPNVSFERTETPVVPKTVVSSTMRFFFPAGLEGTGHHYFYSVLQHLFDNNEELVHISHGVKSGTYAINQSMRSSAQTYVTNMNKARETMRALALKGDDLPFPGTVTFFPGRFSYPNGYGPDKTLHYLDLRVLAEVAEQEGVDFRVVYLRRPAKELLIANTVHRQFQKHLAPAGSPTPAELYMQYMQILLTDVGVLHSLLTELGPGFVVCHDYDLFGDPGQSAAIAEFVAPNADVAAMLNNSFVAVAGVRSPSTESLPFEGASVISSRLQRQLDAFESQLCSGTV